jgi:hypothetical protein
MNDENTIDVYTTSDHMTDRNKAVIAEVGLHVCSEEHVCFTATGSSRRVKEDTHNPHLGHLIAYTRAVENLAQQMKTELKRALRETDGAG